MPVTAKPLTPQPTKPLIKLAGPARLCLFVSLEDGREEVYTLETITTPERLQALIPTKEFVLDTTVLPPTVDARTTAYIVLNVDTQVAPPGIKAGQVFSKAKHLGAALRSHPTGLSGALGYSRLRNPEAEFETGTIKGVTFMRLSDYNEQINRDAKV